MNTSDGATETPPCRLSVLLAHDVPKAVILRRGPTRWVQQILWDTQQDHFEAGQWFRGRIYEQRCDLSPDGRYFLYLARKSQTRERERSSYTHKWTAISRPPYYTALALWPLGDSWDGGGMFLNNRTVLLYHSSTRAHELHRPQGLKIIGNTESHESQSRIVRDGWNIVQHGKFGLEKAKGFILGKGVTIEPAILHKYDPTRTHLLVTEIYRNPHFKWIYSHFLMDEATQIRRLIPNVTWIDWDQQGRLVFARDGKLFVAETLTLELEIRMLANFNAHKPERMLSPRWALKW